MRFSTLTRLACLVGEFIIHRRYLAQVPEEGSGVREQGDGTSPGQIRDARKSRASKEGFAASSGCYVVSGDCAGIGANEDAFVMMILDMLEKDCVSNPQRFGPVPHSLLARARELVEGVTVDLSAPLHPDDD